MRFLNVSNIFQITNYTDIFEKHDQKLVKKGNGTIKPGNM